MSAVVKDAQGPDLKVQPISSNSSRRSGGFVPGASAGEITSSSRQLWKAERGDATTSFSLQLSNALRGQKRFELPHSHAAGTAA